ncbi:hypothetical protein UFOVP250_91 [uncultured Caudovirales phage]|uniref:Uncharacterized protein n=1 Tax=uncultured Caudovirales phage TaxID=2100421 RepID=A0A6J5LJH5_9CAUD|nr:hypothetical protein UFOVP250_91 [uncultured Caudovirales phage]
MFVLRKVGLKYEVYYGSVRMNGAVVQMYEVPEFEGTLAECEKFIDAQCAADNVDPA